MAEELGITRATVYRYFRNMDELLKATSKAAAGEFLDRLAEHVTRLGSAGPECLVEGMAFVIERLPQEPRVGLLVSTGRTSVLSADLLSPLAVEFGLSILRRLPIDWAAYGYDDAAIEDLTRFMLRLLDSFLVEADGGAREVEDPRAFLRRWLVPGFLAAIPARDVAEASRAAGRGSLGE